MQKTYFFLSKFYALIALTCSFLVYSQECPSSTSFSSANQNTFTVPPNAQSITLKAFGADGTNSSSGGSPLPGGRGARVTATFEVCPECTVKPGNVIEFTPGAFPNGASYIKISGSTFPLIIAGGGGDALGGGQGGASSLLGTTDPAALQTRGTGILDANTIISGAGLGYLNGDSAGEGGSSYVYPDNISSNLSSGASNQGIQASGGGNFCYAEIEPTCNNSTEQLINGELTLPTIDPNDVFVSNVNDLEKGWNTTGNTFSSTNNLNFRGVSSAEKTLKGLCKSQQIDICFDLTVPTFLAGDIFTVKLGGKQYFRLEKQQVNLVYIPYYNTTYHSEEILINGQPLTGTSSNSRRIQETLKYRICLSDFNYDGNFPADLKFEVTGSSSSSTSIIIDNISVKYGEMHPPVLENTNLLNPCEANFDLTTIQPSQIPDGLILSWRLPNGVAVSDPTSVTNGTYYAHYTRENTNPECNSGCDDNVRVRVDVDCASATVVSGTVKDFSGVPMQNVTIKLSGRSLAGNNSPQTTLTNTNGEYSFNVFPGNDYTIREFLPPGYLLSSDNQSLDNDITSNNNTSNNKIPVTVVRGDIIDTNNNFINIKSDEVVCTNGKGYINASSLVSPYLATYSVPLDASEITMSLKGENGLNNSGARGGSGATVEATFPVCEQCTIKPGSTVNFDFGDGGAYAIVDGETYPLLVAGSGAHAFIFTYISPDGFPIRTPIPGRGGEADMLNPGTVGPVTVASRGSLPIGTGSGPSGYIRGGLVGAFVSNPGTSYVYPGNLSKTLTDGISGGNIGDSPVAAICYKKKEATCNPSIQQVLNGSFATFGDIDTSQADVFVNDSSICFESWDNVGWRNTGGNTDTSICEKASLSQGSATLTKTISNLCNSQEVEICFEFSIDKSQVGNTVNFNFSLGGEQYFTVSSTNSGQAVYSKGTSSDILTVINSSTGVALPEGNELVSGVVYNVCIKDHHYEGMIPSTLLAQGTISNSGGTDTINIDNFDIKYKEIGVPVLENTSSLTNCLQGFDLTTLNPAITPTGLTLTWKDDNGVVADPTSVDNGTYYAVYSREASNPECADGCADEVLTSVEISCPLCTKQSTAVAGTDIVNYVEISTLNRSASYKLGSGTESSFIKLESKSLPFVITRLGDADLANITEPKEGMLIYNTDQKCLMLYKDFDNDSTLEWRCLSQGCNE